MSQLFSGKDIHCALLDYYLHIEKGIEKGIKKGKAEGKAEGLLAGMRQVAANMKRKGIDLYFARASFVHFPIGNFAQKVPERSITSIMDCTGLSADAILAL